MTILYVMTFGLFSGFAAVFGLLINNQFGRASSIGLPVLGATFAFLGPLIGSLIRMSWGVFCDRMGGAIWTFISGVGMAITLGGIAWVLYNPKGWTDFYIFMALMLLMFLFSGFGNAGTFKQMPMIMPARQAGGAIGFTSAIASLVPSWSALLSQLSARRAHGPSSWAARSSASWPRHCAGASTHARAHPSRADRSAILREWRTPFLSPSSPLPNFITSRAGCFARLAPIERNVPLGYQP